MGGAEAPEGDVGGVLEERLRGLLCHNPAWLGQDAAPPWCADLSMNHEELLERTRQWAATGGGAQGASGSATAPMRVAHNEELGRHLVAARDMAAGEVVVVEPPLLLALRERSPPSCLTCFRRATAYTCPACGFFLCGPECGAAAHAEECEVLRRLGLGQPAPRPEEEARLAALPDEQRAQAREMLQQAAATAEQQRQLEVLRQYRLVAAVRTLLVMHRSPRSGCSGGGAAGPRESLLDPACQPPAARGGGGSGAARRGQRSRLGASRVCRVGHQRVRGASGLG
ncbi:uncharacterized protein LOC135091329 [Scylla paramamosain]|uniref:uncharacterized protein LOC135091329 n=1 Tax=Scylla paramamosain TaxID=85552 RepID=UPI0030831107